MNGAVGFRLLRGMWRQSTHFTGELRRQFAYCSVNASVYPNSGYQGKPWKRHFPIVWPIVGNANCICGTLFTFARNQTYAQFLRHCLILLFASVSLWSALRRTLGVCGPRSSRIVLPRHGSTGSADWQRSKKNHKYREK